MFQNTKNIQSLDYLRTMSKSRWAWEFLRRNPDYIKDFSSYTNGALYRQRRGNLELLRLSRAEPEAEKWGLLFFASPRKTAQEAPVFWTQAANSKVIKVETRPCLTEDQTKPIETLFDLRLIHGHPVHLTDGHGQEHALLERKNRVVQMKVYGNTLLNGDVKLNFILEGFDSLDNKLKMIKRLEKLYDNRVENSVIATDWTARTANLRDALIALDIYQAGKHHIDAALAIYGERAIESGHSSFEGALKNRMYRARKRGIELMQGGYLNLIK